MQIQQRVYLDGTLVRTESCPRKQRQAQIDGSGIQRIQAVIQVEAKRFVGIHGPRDGDQLHREIRIDAPVAALVCIGESCTGNLAANSHVVQFGVHCT